MSTHRSTWKARERAVARYFGSERTPLSGGNSKITRSDSMHKRLFIEDKLRVAHTAVTLWRETKAMADVENKIPVVCLCEKGKPGFWILVHCNDLKQVAAEMADLERGYICKACAEYRKGVWPEGHMATMHEGTCPDCGNVAGLASVGDYNWPKGSNKPKHSAGRD